jgi:glycosyltransferase involved in cell wall biosynthesis
MNKKVTLACEWLHTYGGAERVLSSLTELYPEAKIITSYYQKDVMSKHFPPKSVEPIWIDRIPVLKTKYKITPLLRALAFKLKRPVKTDLLIVSSGSEAKALRVASGGIQVTYCHAPTHFLWQRTDEYTNNTGLGLLSLIAKPAMKMLLPILRKLDYAAAKNPDYIIANSNHTKNMIKKYYKRDSVVIHPPVATDRLSPLALKFKRSGFIITGRHAPYKGFDLAVAACTKLNIELTVLGKGPETENLKKMAGPTIKFKGWVSEEEKEELIAKAEGFLFPGIDDFGISAVEALAAGTPVIALKAGGALDYIVDEQNGIFFADKNEQSLISAIKRFGDIKFNTKAVSQSAEKFSEAQFKKKISEFINKLGLEK